MMNIELKPIESLTGSERGERADAAANRRLILATAERLFAERSVQAVCMAEIAEAAGVGKGTLYRRFANKAELCLALMDTQLMEFQDKSLSEFRRSTEQGIPYLEQLAQFLISLVDFTDMHTPLLAEVEREGRFGAQAPLAVPHFWQYLTVQGLLKQAALNGEISADLDLEFWGEAILAPLQMDVYLFQREVRNFSIDRIRRGLYSLVSLLAKSVEARPLR